MARATVEIKTKRRSTAHSDELKACIGTSPYKLVACLRNSRVRFASTRRLVDSGMSLVIEPTGDRRSHCLCRTRNLSSFPCLAKDPSLSSVSLEKVKGLPGAPEPALSESKGSPYFG